MHRVATLLPSESRPRSIALFERASFTTLAKAFPAAERFLRFLKIFCILVAALRRCSLSLSAFSCSSSTKALASTEAGTDTMPTATTTEQQHNSLPHTEKSLMG